MEEPVVLPNDSDNPNIPEPLIRNNTRDILPYKQLLKQTRAVLDSSEITKSTANTEKKNLLIFSIFTFPTRKFQTVSNFLTNTSILG
jgi:hypothetical protein